VQCGGTPREVLYVPTSTVKSTHGVTVYGKCRKYGMDRPGHLNKFQ
jgi:hypothetical protein